MPSNQFRWNTPGPRPITTSLPFNTASSRICGLSAIRRAMPSGSIHTRLIIPTPPNTNSQIRFPRSIFRLRSIDQHEGAIVGRRIHALARLAGDCQHRHRVRGEVAHPISQDPTLSLGDLRLDHEVNARADIRIDFADLHQAIS